MSLLGSQLVSPAIRQLDEDPHIPLVHVSALQQSASSRHGVPTSSQAHVFPEQFMSPQQSAPVEHDPLCSEQQFGVESENVARQLTPLPSLQHIVAPPHVGSCNDRHDCPDPHVPFMHVDEPQHSPS